MCYCLFEIHLVLLTKKTETMQNIRNSEKGNLFLALCFLIAALGLLVILVHVRHIHSVDGLFLGFGALEIVILILDLFQKSRNS